MPTLLRLSIQFQLQPHSNINQYRSELESIVKKYQNQNEDIQEEQGNNEVHKFPFFQFYSNPNTFPSLQKENFIFIACDRNTQTILDYCKVADIICPVLSCKETKADKINLDPYQNAKAFDDFGYNILNCIRIQGMPQQVCVMQHANLFSGDKQKNVKKLFQRYFSSEFNETFISLEGEQTFMNYLRILQGAQLKSIDWREMRGYMLADQVTYNKENKILEIQGFLKGSHLNANQLIHITGYDDYQIEKIEVLRNPFKLRLKSKKQRVQIFSSSNQSRQVSKQGSKLDIEKPLETEGDQEMKIEGGKVLFEQFSHPEKIESLQKSIKQSDIIEADNTEKLLNEINELKIGEEEEIEEKQEKGSDMSEEAEGIDDQGSDISADDIEMNAEQMQEEKRRIKFEFMERDKEDLEFEDEIDYHPDTILKDRLCKYQGLKSFKTSEWDVNANLPDEYQNIYTFKNYYHAKKIAIQESIQNAFAYSGFYIKIYIKNVDEKIITHPKDHPLIISNLFKHERKLTQVHLKVQKNLEDDNLVIKSKVQPYLINMGFRRFVTNPIFSRHYNNNKKSKYFKEIKNFTGNILASFYHPCSYTPQKALIFESEDMLNNAIYALKGDLMKVDNFQVILKRVILTGYPYKIHKRKSVIRFMFFNAKDIKYFAPIELRTRLGLIGQVQEAIGTHGMMKCVFNGGLKQHDTVMIPLYKRVFPKNTRIIYQE